MENFLEENIMTDDLAFLDWFIGQPENWVLYPDLCAFAQEECTRARNELSGEMM